MLRKRIFLIIFYFYFNVNFTKSNSKIFLKIPDEASSHYENVFDKIDYRNSRTRDDVQLITKVLEIVNQAKSGVTRLEISKCLYLGNTKQKLNCIKRLIYKGRSKNNDNKPYFYTNFLNKDILPYEHKFDDHFIDLIKSSHENDAQRTFQTIINFSDDYLDINDLLRTNAIDRRSVDTDNKDDMHISKSIPNKNELNDLRYVSDEYLDIEDLLKRYTKITQATPKEMKNSIGNNNDLRGLKLIPSKNKINYLRHLRNISQDYLDINDFLRTNTKMANQKPKETKNTKNLYVFKLIPIKNEIKDFRRFRNIVPKDDSTKKEILRSDSIDTDSSDESDESKSKEEKVERKGIKDRLYKKPKRFQVIESLENTSSEDDKTSDESDIPIQRPIELPRRHKKVLYMQAPNRIFKIRNEGRRRLPHFFPKRYHWDEEDMRNLDNYWFSGPQGKYWGHYKTPH